MLPRRGWLALAALGVIALAAAGPGVRAWAARGERGEVGVQGEAGGVRWAASPEQASQAPAAGALLSASRRGPGAPAEDAGGFSHRKHRSVQCTSCHLSSQSHGALKVRTSQDCVACHHGTAKPAGCTRCHDADKIAAEVQRTVLVRTTVAKTASTRSLPFAHAFHKTVVCGDCHGAAPNFKATKDCTGCHERHHTEARDCQRCHRAEDVKGHPALASHQGCAGSGCHGDAAVVRLSWSRNVCTACHQDRARHEVGRDCAACHQVPALHPTRKEVAP